MYKLLHSQKLQDTVSSIDSNQQFIAAGDLCGSTSVWKFEDTDPWNNDTNNEPFHQTPSTSMGLSDCKLEADAPELYISSLDSTIKKQYLDSEPTPTPDITITTPLLANYRLDLNGDTLLSAGEQGRIGLYEKSTLLKVSEIKAGDQFITSLYSMKDKRMLAAGNSSGTLSLINLQKDNRLAYFSIHTKLIRGVKIIEGRFELVSVSDDKTVKIFDINKEQVYLNLSEHTQPVTCLDTHPKQNSIFMTAGLDKMVRVWDLRQKGAAGRYEMEAEVWSVRYWRTGRVFMVGMEDGTLGVYGV